MARKKNPEPVQAFTTAIYARYSSSVQNDASIEQQIAECEEYARQKNLTIVATYEDRAISGKRDNRPGLQRMLRAADRHEFQVLLAYKSNRISRNMTNALRYEERLSRAGVKVVYCKEEFGDNATGRFMLRTMMNMNQFYSENMAEDIRRGLRDSAQKCKVVSTIPYGYKKGPDGRYALDEEAAKVVAEIFRRFLNDESYVDIADELNRRNVLTKQGKKWKKNSFHTILENERYTGVYIYDDIRIDDGMPKIIERSVFEMAKKKLSDYKIIRARKHDDNDYLLTGKLFCGYCCGAMVGYSGTGHLGTKYFYYACQTRRTQGSCEKSNIKKDVIEEEVTRAVLETVLDDDTVDWIVDNLLEFAKKYNAKSKLATYEKQLKGTKKQIDNIVHAIEMGVMTDEIKERMDVLQADKNRLTGLIAIEKANTFNVDRDRVTAYIESVRNGDYRDPEFQRMIIRDFVRAVYLYKDYFKLSVDFTGDNKMFEIRLISKENPASEDSGQSADSDRVSVSREWYTIADHNLTCHIKNQIALTASGFVITWYFPDRLVC